MMMMMTRMMMMLKGWRKDHICRLVNLKRSRLNINRSRPAGCCCTRIIQMQCNARCVYCVYCVYCTQCAFQCNPMWSNALNCRMIQMQCTSVVYMLDCSNPPLHSTVNQTWATIHIHTAPNFRSNQKCRCLYIELKPTVVENYSWHLFSAKSFQS